MNILIVGLGSIGRRHLSNIVSLGYADISVVTRSGAAPLNSQVKHSYKTVAEALANDEFDAAVVCTPTAFHLDTVLPLLDAGVERIYLEKPVSHNLEGVDSLLNRTASSSSTIIVGYDLHFDPGLLKVKALLDQSVIGNVISVNAAVGQYLPDWRPDEDYRKGMSARKETGGGVLLDLVHEFDYLYWLFGQVSHIGCITKNSGTLEIETEDVADVMLKFQNGISGTIHLDYLQPALVRNCMITGSNGTIFWNLAASEVRWIARGKEEHAYSYQGFNRNDRFVNIISAFLSDIADARLTSLLHGVESLKMAVNAKKASEQETIIHLNDIMAY
jgi:predicted dehydrogenase